MQVSLACGGANCPKRGGKADFFFSFFTTTSSAISSYAPWLIGKIISRSSWAILLLFFSLLVPTPMELFLLFFPHRIQAIWLRNVSTRFSCRNESAACLIKSWTIIAWIFGTWGLIHLLLIGMLFYQFTETGYHTVVEGIGWRFPLLCLMTAVFSSLSNSRSSHASTTFVLSILAFVTIIFVGATVSHIYRSIKLHHPPKNCE